MDGDLGRSSGAVTKQRVDLAGDDRNISHAIYAQDVTVIRNELDSSIASSNKVKCTPVVNYDWEARKYNGQLVATDQQHQYIAYSVKGRSGGIVRLLHRELADRVLLRGHTGAIVDLQFSYSTKTILASIDEHCHLFVNIIDLTNVNSDQSRISTTDALEIKFEGNANEEKHITWCHAVSNDEFDDDDPLGNPLDHSMSLAVTSGNNVYVLHITSIIEEHGSGPHSLDDIRHSIIYFSEHTRSITSVTFSPEGSALSTSSEDGTVLFYSIELRRPSDGPSNKRLFKWSPHDGLPVTMVKFLDNFDKLDDEEDNQFWKFCVTGTNENTEIKLWSCENWKCLQTLRFVNSTEDDSMTLNAQIDNGGKFLILSDINSTVLYILSLHQDSLIKTAHTSGISELLLGAPALSFAIISVKKKSEQQESSDESTDEEGDTTPDTKIIFQLQVIQPKVMQDVSITLTPIVSPSTEFGSIAVASSINSHHVQDHISERSSPFSTDQSHSDRKNLSEEYVKVSPLPLEMDGRSDRHSSDDEQTTSINETSSTSHVLLTPDAFTSNKNNGSLVMPTDVGQSPKSGISSLTHVTHDSHMTQNSLIPNNVNTFIQGSSISTVSSINSPNSSLADKSLDRSTADRSVDRSSVGADNLTPTRSLTREHDSTPTNAAEQKVVLEQATDNNDETARQLEQLFKMPLSANQSLELSTHLTVLTEDDLLNPVDQALPHSVNKSNSGEDRSGWPIPPEVRESAQRQPAAPLAEDTGDLTDESDTESDEDNVSSSDMGKQSDVEELNVKEIEKDAGDQLDMRSPGGGNIPVDEPVMPQFVQTRILSQLDQLSSEMSTIKQMLDIQAREIHSLKNSDHTQAEKQTSSKQTQMYFTSLTNKIDELSHNISREQREQINTSLSDMRNYITHEIKNTVEKTVINELNSAIVPCLTNMVNPVKLELHRVMAEKLTVADATFKESVNRLVNNKQMVEYIGRYVATTLQSTVTSVFRDSLQQIVVPGFDSATRNMFNQLNQTFTAGLNQYMKQVEEQVLVLIGKQMNTQELVSTSCETAVNALKQSSTDVRQHVTDTIRTEVSKHVKQSINSMKTQLIRDIKETIKTELGSVLTNQEEMLNKQFEELRTIAATPEPKIATVQAQIDAQLQLNNYETALSMSLSASDLDIVLYCIRKIDSDVFSDDSSIQSPTLLSLIQQLGVVIDEPELDLKLNFLSEAVLKLDPTDEVISQHMGPVLKQVQDRLEEFLRNNSSSTCKHQVRAVMFSIKSLLRSQRR